MRRVHLDVTPLRASRDVRLLLSAGMVIQVGGMVTYVAVPFQLHHLTGSTFAVRAVGLVATGVAQVALTSVPLANATVDRPGCGSSSR